HKTEGIRGRIFSQRRRFYMRKSKFSDSQIMTVLKRAEAGEAVPDLCREVTISTATFYKWRAAYGGMGVSMMARMKEPEEENRRLRKMYMDETVKAEIVAEALAKKWRGHLTGVRWPQVLLPGKA